MRISAVIRAAAVELYRDIIPAPVGEPRAEPEPVALTRAEPEPVAAPTYLDRVGWDGDC